ncbi:hypothetical protein D3C81_1773150 [compost metagenome]
MLFSILVRVRKSRLALAKGSIAKKKKPAALIHTILSLMPKAAIPSPAKNRETESSFT